LPPTPEERRAKQNRGGRHRKPSIENTPHPEEEDVLFFGEEGQEELVGSSHLLIS